MRSARAGALLALTFDDGVSCSLVMGLGCAKPPKEVCKHYNDLRAEASSRRRRVIKNFDTVKDKSTARYKYVSNGALRANGARGPGRLRDRWSARLRGWRVGGRGDLDAASWPRG